MLFEKLVVASHNKGKIAEISHLLAPYARQVVGGTEFALQEPEETGATFAANAQIKAEYFLRHTSMPSLADDSGLVVPFIDGQPGIYSARWAGESRDFGVAMESVARAIEERAGDVCGQDKYAAYFICALCLATPAGEMYQVEGRVDGHLQFPPAGDRGFGYDPIFIPEGYGQTFAQMEPEYKHKISHRARAFDALLDALAGSRR